MLRQLIADELERRGWNRYQLAKLMTEQHGYGQSVVYNWLAGRRNISLQAFEDMCQILRIRLVPVQMLPDEDAPPPLGRRRAEPADDQPDVTRRRRRPPADRE
jgi:transcriptional regulator with XRE-family HTH domain